MIFDRFLDPKIVQNGAVLGAKIFPKSKSQKTPILFNNFRCFGLVARKLRCGFRAIIRNVLLPLEEVCVVAFGRVLAPKNLPKNHPKRGPSDEQIDAKKTLFFNIVFFAFRPQFGSILELQVGAKLSQNGPQTWGRGLPRAFLS